MQKYMTLLKFLKAFSTIISKTLACKISVYSLQHNLLLPDSKIMTFLILDLVPSLLTLLFKTFNEKKLANKVCSPSLYIYILYAKSTSFGTIIATGITLWMSENIGEYFKLSSTAVFVDVFFFFIFSHFMLRNNL